MTDSYSEKKQLLYNSRIVDTYIKLIKRKYNYININELLSFAKMKPYEVADQGHWFTQEHINLFHERLVQLTRNKNISREAGQYAASPESIGVMRQYILGMVGPAKAYELIGAATKNFTRSSIYESTKIASNKIEIVVTLQEGVTEKSFQCENRKGHFEAISTAFTNKLPKIEHPECMFEGGDKCRYIITWEKSFSALLKRTRNCTALLLFLICIFVVIVSRFIIHPSFTLFGLGAASIFIVFVLTVIGEHIENKELKAGLSNLGDSTNKLVDQININYNNALLTNEIGQAVSKLTNIEEVLENVVSIFQKRLDYDRGLILLANKEKTRLSFRAGFGYFENQLEFLKNTEFHLDRPESKGVFISSFRERKAFLINDINDIGHDMSQRSLAFAKKMKTQSFICCPIICDGESIGILAVDNLQSKRLLLQSDKSLLLGIAPVIGVSIRNAELNDTRIRQFRSILYVLAASIDARDPMTSGHSEKVTEYAMGICKELNLSDDYREVIRVAAALHDYGKIGVPDALLMKEGILTGAEYEVIKTHANKTREILEQVNFEGLFSQVPEIAGSHHEKIDGSGYPQGLKKDEIPLGSQIIAVADFFEAVTSKRHYRGPMPLNEAFLLLREESDTHFEKNIIEAFISFYIREHR